MPEITSLPLEETCPTCEGERFLVGGRKCSNCKGQGAVPTEFGSQVLEFIQNRLGIRREEDGVMQQLVRGEGEIW